MFILFSRFFVLLKISSMGAATKVYFLKSKEFCINKGRPKNQGTVFSDALYDLNLSDGYNRRGFHAKLRLLVRLRGSWSEPLRRWRH